MPRFITFNGKHDTRRNDGRDYDTISFAEIRQMCLKPNACAKDYAPAFLASTYHGHLGRCHEEQRQRGTYHALIADIDIGSPSLAEVDQAIADVVGDHARLVYSSSSASEDQKKWRVIVPVRNPIPGAEYSTLQAAFFDELGARGIICDYAPSRSGQPVYLPNVPPHLRDADGKPLFYQHLVKEAKGLPKVPVGVQTRAADAARVREEAKAHAEAETRRKAAERRRQRQYPGLLSPIEQFNTENELEILLLENGWEPRGQNRYASPYSQSKGPSVYVYGQRAVSFTSSDVGQIGRTTANGWTTYDAWDVYVARVHGGNTAMALLIYREQSGYDQRVLQAILHKWRSV